MPIKNDRQLEISKDSADAFRKAIEDFRCDQSWDHDPVIRKAVLEGMESQLQTIEEEIHEYERGHAAD